MLKGECRKDKFLFEYDYPDHFTNCFWSKQPKIVVTWMAYRLFLTLYFFLVLLMMIFFRPEKGYVWYKNVLYISTLTCLFEIVLFGVSFSLTVVSYVKRKKNPRLRPLKKMPWHYKTLWFWYSWTASNVIVVTVMYWLLIYNPEIDIYLMFLIASRFFNSVLLIIDYFLSDIPYRLLHMYIPCIFPLVYAIFTLIYQFSGGTGNLDQPAIYSIIDWKTPLKPFSFMMMYIMMCVFSHCGMCSIYFLKLWIKKSREERRP